jgi:hypothetical protein
MRILWQVSKATYNIMHFICIKDSFKKRRKFNIIFELTLGSSNPNISKIPINPSVACLTALFKAAIDLLDFDPAVPTVEACWLATCKE